MKYFIIFVLIGLGGIIALNLTNQHNPIVNSKDQIIANSYKDAIKKSGEEGMPVLIFFEADWANLSQKMKRELTTDKVKEIMKNYILVFIDYDKDRATHWLWAQNKHSQHSTILPSYVITNMNEAKLKLGDGYLDADKFYQWLNNPSMYKQPKKMED